MKRKLFLMGVLALIVSGGIFWSCQKEELLNSEELMLKKGKANTIEVAENPFTWTEACAGQEIVFTLEGTQNSDQIRIWGLNIETGEYGWLNVGTRSYTTTLPAGTYYFSYRLNNSWYPSNPSAKMEEGIMVLVESCDCEWETATAYAGDTEGENNGSPSEGFNNAWWFAFDTEGESIQNIWANENEKIGTATYENRVLTLDLGEWELQDVDEPVKYYLYDELPTEGRPTPGKAFYKGDNLELDTEGKQYVVVHLDVSICR